VGMGQDGLGDRNRGHGDRVDMGMVFTWMAFNFCPGADLYY